MLKFSFLVIVLVNLIFLFWEFQHGAFLQKPAVNPSKSHHDILLLSEMPAIKTTAHQDNTPKIPAPDTLLAKKISTSQPALDDKPVAIRLPSSSNLDNPPSPSHTTPDQQTVASALRPVDNPIGPTPTEENIAQLDSAQKMAVTANPETSDTVSPSETNKDSGEKADAPNKEKIVHCFEQQVFESKKAAVNWLNQQAIPGEIQKIEQAEPGSYLVFIPAAENYAQAKQTVNKLQEKGIKDFWLFRKGPMKNAISLGLFIKQQRAENLARQLQSKGIDVKIETRYKSVKRWSVTPVKRDCVNTIPQLP